MEIWWWGWQTAAWVYIRPGPRLAHHSATESRSTEHTTRCASMRLNMLAGVPAGERVSALSSFFLMRTLSDVGVVFLHGRYVRTFATYALYAHFRWLRASYNTPLLLYFFLSCNASLLARIGCCFTVTRRCVVQLSCISSHVLTISRGPMARKKASREQYASVTSAATVCQLALIGTPVSSRPVLNDGSCASSLPVASLFASFFATLR